MTAQVHALPDPLTAGLDEVGTGLHRMTVGCWEGHDEVEIRVQVGRMMRFQAMLAGQLAAATRVLDESGLAKRTGSASTAAMLAGDFGGDTAASNRVVKTGKALAGSAGAEAALARGQLTERQATITANAVKDVPAEHKQAVEAKMIEAASKLLVKDFQRRADRISDLYKPEPEVDADENAIVEDRETRAYKGSKFRMWDNHDGTHSGNFTIPEAEADVLRTTLQAMTAPRRSSGDFGVPQGTPNDTKMGQAFAELAAKATPEALINGGPTLVVTTDYETLEGKLKVATMETGTRLSASQARRLACHAKILPAVMNGASVVLDHGRTKRLFTPNQRIALTQRDGGCAYPGCDRPPAWCEAHHWRQKWSDGGTTDLADGVLLCGHHHRLVHSQRIEIRAADDGIIEFRPPGARTWQRKRRYRP